MINSNQHRGGAEFKTLGPVASIRGQVVALRGHCVHLPENSPKITCHLSASRAKPQSPQDNNQHMRGHMGPKAIRGVAHLAPSTNWVRYNKMRRDL